MKKKILFFAAYIVLVLLASAIIVPKIVPLTEEAIIQRAREKDYRAMMESKENYKKLIATEQSKLLWYNHYEIWEDNGNLVLSAYSTDNLNSQIILENITYYHVFGKRLYICSLKAYAVIDSSSFCHISYKEGFSDEKKPENNSVFFVNFEDLDKEQQFFLKSLENGEFENNPYFMDYNDDLK